MIRLLRLALEKLGARGTKGRRDIPASLSGTRGVASTHGDARDSTRKAPASASNQALPGKSSERLDVSGVDLREMLRRLGLSESDVNEILDASTDPSRRLLLDSLAERRGKRHGGSSSSPIGGR